MPSFLEFLCPHEAIYNIKVSWGKSYTNTSYLHASSRAFATDSSSVQIEGHAEGPPVLACRIPHSSWGSFSVSPKVLGDNGAKSKTLLMLLCDACKECIISGAMESPRMATQRGAILTKSHVLPLFLQSCMFHVCQLLPLKSYL